MKNYLLLSLLLSFSPAWASQVDSQETMSEDEQVLEQTLASEETSTQKFSSLVKSTMDLMSPVQEATEVASTPDTSTTP